jgi:hypothetical protein
MTVLTCSTITLLDSTASSYQCLDSQLQHTYKHISSHWLNTQPPVAVDNVTIIDDKLSVFKYTIYWYKHFI